MQRNSILRRKWERTGGSISSVRDWNINSNRQNQEKIALLTLEFVIKR